MSFIDFVDKEGQVHKIILGLSLIVLKEKNNEIRRLRKQFVKNNILFTETITGDTYKDMNYFCVTAFGEKNNRFFDQKIFIMALIHFKMLKKIRLFKKSSLHYYKYIKKTCIKEKGIHLIIFNQTQSLIDKSI